MQRLQQACRVAVGCAAILLSVLLAPAPLRAAAPSPLRGVTRFLAAPPHRPLLSHVTAFRRRPATGLVHDVRYYAGGRGYAYGRYYGYPRFYAYPRSYGYYGYPRAYAYPRYYYPYPYAYPYVYAYPYGPPGY
jgi:hypothetical protein